jgi:hypothetical protein
VTEKLDPEEWKSIVAEVLTAQPELAAATVQAMQAGILAALNRRSDRLADVSLGLAEAIRTKPGQAGRNRALIVRAIEASTVHPTKWSEAAISKEQT